MLTEARGIPLVVDLMAANDHDRRAALPLVMSIPEVRGKPGRPKGKPAALVADKAFDCDSLRSLLRWIGIEPLIPKRGDEQHGLGEVRWFIERTISWLHQFRRLRIRWDRRPHIHQAFLKFAAGVICHGTWVNAI